MSAKEWWTKHGSTLMFIFGAGGSIASTIIAIKQTPKAMELVDEASREKYRKCKELGIPYDGLTNFEKLKSGGKAYILPAAIQVGSLGLLCASKTVDASAIASLTNLLGTALNNNQIMNRQLEANLSPQKLSEVRGAIAQDTVNSIPVDPKKSKLVAENTGYGDSYFTDNVGGRLYKCSAEKIRSAINDINEMLNSGNTGYGVNSTEVPFNEFYSRIGLSEVRLGEYVGWRSPRDMDGGELAKIITVETDYLEDGMTPVSVISFNAHTL